MRGRDEERRRKERRRKESYENKMSKKSGPKNSCFVVQRLSHVQGFQILKGDIVWKWRRMKEKERKKTNIELV